MSDKTINLILSVLKKAYAARAISFRDYDYCRWLLVEKGF